MDYQRLVDGLTTSIIVIDQTRSVRHLNESAEVFIQSSVNRIVGKPLSSVIEVDEVLDKAIDRIFLTQVSIRLRQHALSVLCLLRQRNVDCLLTPVFLAYQWMVVMEMTETGVMDSHQPLIDRQQIGYTLIRGLAHEIRNPLGGIRGAAQLLAAELQNEALKSHTDIIIREADRLSGLVSRMQSPTRLKIEKHINIHGLLEHVHQLVRISLPDRIRIITDYDPSLPNIAGDPERLTQAMINIVQNAVEAIEDQGTIIIKTRIDHRILSGEMRKRQVVKISIIDNGIGIDPAMTNHIFEPMVTTKRQGTGLGLAITSEIVRQHGGLIEVTSESGKTQFDICLTVAETSHE